MTHYNDNDKDDADADDKGKFFCDTGVVSFCCRTHTNTGCIFNQDSIKEINNLNICSTIVRLTLSAFVRLNENNRKQRVLKMLSEIVNYTCAACKDSCQCGDKCGSSCSGDKSCQCGSKPQCSSCGENCTCTAEKGCGCSH